jgi:threonine-phosphate decarboxylase
MKGHGGDIYAASRKLGIAADQVIDFSASINPLGVPKSVRAEIIAHLGRLRHYPDPSATDITREIARSIRVNQESIFCGNGSTELIYLIVRVLQPRRVLIPAPTFSEYERACVVNAPLIRNSSKKASLDYFDLSEKNNYVTSPREFINAMAGHDLAFICNPNNPTGGLVKKSDMLRIAEAARETGCYLVVDEAFIDFIPRESVVTKVKNNPYLIVLRSLTKFYALSGLRVGYAVINPELSCAIRRFKEPWTVNTLAQLAGTAALKDVDYATKTFRIIEKEKAYLETGFKRLGIRYYPSPVNFYLLRLDNARKALSNLGIKGILLRDCANFRGLGNSHIRIAVRSRSENERLLMELAKLSTTRDFNPEHVKACSS